MQNSTCHIIKRTLSPRKGELYLFGIISILINFSYSLADGASFAEQARGAAFDLAGDEAVANRKRRQLNWDKKKKKFVKGDGVGADNVKIVKTENGTRLPATYRSGRFDEWKAKTRTTLPRVGDTENEGPTRRGLSSVGGRRFKHQKIEVAKPLDKRNKDYERKTRQLKKKTESVGEMEATQHQAKKGGKLKGGRNAGRPIGKVKTELKTVDQVRKSRNALDRRREKTGRHKKHRRR